VCVCVFVCVCVCVFVCLLVFGFLLVCLLFGVGVCVWVLGGGSFVCVVCCVCCSVRLLGHDVAVEGIP
jgi:hypothetical protein